MATEDERRNDIFQTWLEAQRTWMSLWTDTLSGSPKAREGDEGAQAWSSPWKTAEDIYNQWLKMSQEMFGQSWKEVPWGIGVKTFERTLSGAQVYNSLYEFWTSAARILSGAPPEGKGILETYQEFYESWLKTYNEQLKSFFTVSLFAPTGQPGTAAELPQMYADLFSRLFGPWTEAIQNLPKTAAQALQKGPQGYADVYHLWLQAYDQTWGRVLGMPPLGLTRETIEKFQRANEAMIEHYTATTDYSSVLYKVGMEAMQKVATNLGEMSRKGQAPKTFKEFYTLWWTTNEETVHELFKTPEFSHLLGRVTDAATQVRKRYDDVMEEYLKALPVPTRSEMNDLYKTLYMLKKEVRKNTKQMKELENKLKTKKVTPEKEAS